jgi:hypothetical protein
MERNEQKQFIKSVYSQAFEQICEKIDKGQLPETWDGIELRKYAHEFIEENWDSLRYMPKTSRRYKDYKNDKIVNNL